jgi:hypothetical protein
MNSRRLRTLAFLVPPVVAFVCFLIYLDQIRNLPFFKFLVANPLAYDMEARQLLKGIPSGEPFFLSALYPAFVALVYRLSGESRFALMVVQGGLLGLNIWLIGLISKRLFSGWTALGACLVMTFSWSLYYFAGEMVPATIFLTYLLAGILLFLDRDREQPAIVGFAAVGAGVALTFVYATPGLGHLGALLARRSLPEPASHYLAGLSCFLILTLGCAVWLVGPRLWTRLAPARNLIASGLALGLGTLVWSGAAVFAGMLALWLVMRRGTRAAAVLLAAGFLVPVLSSLTYNCLVSGDFIPVTASFGVNLYIGNNPASDGMDPFRFGEGNRTKIEADRLRLSGKRRSDFYTAEAVKFITGEPSGWLRLEGRKLVISLSRVQINNNADIAERRAAWKHFFLPGLHFGIIFPLAAAGAVSAIRENRRALILVAGYVSFLIIPLVFFACERFRLPAIAMLVPLAAYGTEMVIRFAARRAPTDLVVTLAVVAIAGLASNLDFLGLAKYEMPSIVANKAYVARLAGNSEEARRLALRALSLDARTAGAYFQLGAIAQEGGRLTEALTYYLDCLEADPYFMAAYEAAARVLEAARINRSYLDAYVDDLTNGGDYAGARAKMVGFVKARVP